MFLPDSLYVHGLRVPQSVPGRGRSHDAWHVTAVDLARPGVGRVVVVVVVWRVPVAVVQEQRRVCLCGVHVLHGGVHVIHQPLQVDVVICAGGGGEQGLRLISSCLGWKYSCPGNAVAPSREEDTEPWIVLSVVIAR